MTAERKVIQEQMRRVLLKDTPSRRARPASAALISRALRWARASR